LAALLRYSISKGYPIYTLEFGNELNGGKGFVAQFDAVSFAHDFAAFTDVIQSAFAQQPGLPIPRTLVPGGGWDPVWFAQFLQTLQGLGQQYLPGVVSHHLYSLGSGMDPTCGERALNVADLDKIRTLAINASGVVANNIQPGAPGLHRVWVGESGGASSSGRNNVTNAFNSGFWYLDQMVRVMPLCFV
jgi:heparanase 1